LCAGDTFPGDEYAGAFCSLSSDNTIRFWSTQNWSCLRAVWIGGPAGAPSGDPLSFAYSSGYFVVGFQDGRVRLWSALEIQPEGLDISRLVSDVAKVRGARGERGGRLSVDGSDAGTLVERVERQMERTLREFIRIRTISPDPQYSAECFRGAKYLSRLLESLGADVRLSSPVEGKNPVVIGRLGRDPTKATVCMYGHYDVQPAQEREWATDPFELTSIDGYLYGRGVSDNKGPLLAMVYAVKELAAEGVGAMPVNVAFCFEGEEENGSKGFMEAVKGYMSWFEGTKMVLCSNTLWIGETKPCLTYGMRGMISMSVQVSGPDKEIHSGNDGGVFNEPMNDLVKVLGTLVDSRTNILIPGFYKDVAMQGCDGKVHALAFREGMDGIAAEFSTEGYRHACGVPALSHASEAEVLRARWCRPSMSLVDVVTGADGIEGSQHTALGPTRFSVIPHNAVGKVSVRFVPNQKAEVLMDHFRRHVTHEFEKLHSANELTVHVHNIGDYWMGSKDSGFFKAAAKAIEQVWGVEPLYVREGGTMPVTTCLETLLNAPAVHLPMGQSSDAPHLANERLKRANLVKGRQVIINMMFAIAQLHAEEVGEKLKIAISLGLWLIFPLKSSKSQFHWDFGAFFL